MPPGGHLEDNEVLHEAAIREVFEETGIWASPMIDEHEVSLDLQGEKDVQIPRPYALLYQVIPASSKEGEHIHIDMIFRLYADDTLQIPPSAREIYDVRWCKKQQITDSLPTFDSVISFAKKNLI